MRSKLEVRGIMKNDFRGSTIIILAIVILAIAMLQGCATPIQNTSPEAIFKEGEEAFYKKRYDDAITSWKKVKESYHSPELSAKAELGIADAYFLNKEYIEASAAYEDFRKLHPSHDRAGYALFREGMSFYNGINRIDTDQTPLLNSLSKFKSYLQLYPNGENAQDVAGKIRECREKQLKYELYIGNYYLKTDKYSAAIARFEGAMKLFADLPLIDELLYNLGCAYKNSGQQEKGVEIFSRLVQEFPGSRYVPDAKKLIAK
jgi:outer membrane protein assembly factor BamD